MLRYKLKQLLADKEFAERRQITLKEVATSLGINRMTLSKLANHPGANVTTDNIDKLCGYFNCAIQDLVEFVPEEPKPNKKHPAVTPNATPSKGGVLRR